MTYEVVSKIKEPSNPITVLEKETQFDVYNQDSNFPITTSGEHNHKVNESNSIEGLMDKFMASKWLESPDTGTLERRVMLYYSDASRQPLSDSD